MSLIEIILLGISLSMDAFAVSIATGISLKDLRFHHAAKVGLFFGGFQFLMPVLGYWAGSQGQLLYRELRSLDCLWPARNYRRQDAD